MTFCDGMQPILSYINDLIQITVTKRDISEPPRGSNVTKIDTARHNRPTNPRTRKSCEGGFREAGEIPYYRGAGKPVLDV